MPTSEVLDLIQACVVSILILGAGIPIARALAKRIAAPKAARPALPPEDSERMERVERAIEAISVEVERIAESQRFMTKLLASGEKAPALPGPR